MELEKWLEKYDIRKKVMEDLRFYLDEYRKEDEVEFRELFKNMDFEQINYELHSVAYVINTWHTSENEERKYISTKVRLEYEDSVFAEYEAIYDLEGNGEDDYLRSV